MEGDDRTFRANFTTGGVARLRELVEKKLKEFMGDYTDDTLVEYVIVLLKNGRQKDEAKSELNVFLGDDSDSFVTWLWDHLGSHLSLYVEESNQDGVPKTKQAAKEPSVKVDSHKIESESEKQNFVKTTGRRHNREWKGLVRDDDANATTHTQSSTVENVNPQEDTQRRVGRSKQPLSPRRTIEKKRTRYEERQPSKRDVSQATNSAPRRLLQFALRDAVAPAKPTVEPSLKRLRSIVSTSTVDYGREERPKRTVPGSRNAMTAAIKASAEAVKDVRKVEQSRNIFDRLGVATDVLYHASAQDDYRGLSERADSHFAEDRTVEDYLEEREDFQIDYHQQNGSDTWENRDMSEDPITASDVGYNVDVYDGDVVMGRGAMNISRTGISSGNWVEAPLIVPSSEASVFDERVVLQYNDLDQPVAEHDMSHKNPSYVNTTTWNVSQNQDVRQAYGTVDRKLRKDVDTMAATTETFVHTENNNLRVASNGNAKPEADVPYESLKVGPSIGFHATDVPTEDADSRTVFVNNVNFAATKDSLSRHFSKFGEVLKVIILIDPTSGQPKGSAYIEFMRKETAENALSLDGTSFMSRILKITRKSSALPEAAASVVATWPRVARAPPYPTPRFIRAPFGRGLYRGGRVPIRAAGRSFQWKRGGASELPLPSPTTRSLTYVRPQEANTN